MKKVYLLLITFGCLSLLLVACSDSATAPLQGAIVPGPITTPATEEATAVPTATLAAAPATATPLPATPETAAATAVIAPTDVPATPTLQAVPASAEATATSVPTATQVPVRTTTVAAKTTTVAAKPTATTKPVQSQPTFTPVPLISSQPYNGALSEVVRGKTGKKQVAITLDAGAGAEPFPKMLTALKNADVKITFFLTGMWAQQNPIYVQQIVAGGHEIANHTWDHPDLTTVTNEKIKDEIDKTDALLSRFTGKSTKPIFRFPYGSRDSRTSQYVNSLGYRSIFWTIDSLDSVGEVKSAQFLIDRITKQTNAQLDGEIILMHIGNATTADALPVIIQNLEDRGFQVVTVSKLLQ